MEVCSQLRDGRLGESQVTSVMWWRMSWYELSADSCIERASVEVHLQAVRCDRLWCMWLFHDSSR